MRQFKAVLADSIDALLHALCEIVSSNDYLARQVPDVADETIEQKMQEKERERGREKKRGLVEEEGTEERVHCFCGRIPCIT